MTRLNQFDVEKISSAVEMSLNTLYHAFLKNNTVLRIQLNTALTKVIQKQTEREMQDEEEHLVYEPIKVALTGNRDIVSVLCLVKNQKRKGVGRSATKGQTISFTTKLPANLVFEFQKLEKMKEYL